MRTSQFLALPLMILALLYSSCQKIAEEELEGTGTEQQVLKVNARTSDSNRIPYPLHIYVFDEGNTCIDSQQIANEEKELELQLPQGNYQIAAVSDVSGSYTLPDSPIPQSLIKLNSVNGAQKPLMTGHASIQVTSRTHELSLSLSYAVTHISVALKNVPTDVAEVTVAISSLYSSLSLSGSYSGELQRLLIPCQLDTENIWSANGVYAFPGIEDKTSINITLKKKDQTEETYAYTYDGKPEANKPFNINGNYIGKVTIGGNIISNNWEDATDVDFDFGAAAEDGDSGEDSAGGNEEEGSTDTDTQPDGTLKAGDIWNNGIVVSTTYGSNKQVLLMSLDEGKCQAEELYDYMDEHVPDRWRLPNEAEAYLMNQTFQGDALEALNEKLESKGYPIIKTDKYRYFYDSGGDIYAFGFKPTSKFQPAGESTQYYIRTVSVVSQ